jgi:hypothetical protein
MSLDNLVKIGRLKAHSATAAEVSDLLAAADRNLADARVGAISARTGLTPRTSACIRLPLSGCWPTGIAPTRKSLATRRR